MFKRYTLHYVHNSSWVQSARYRTIAECLALAKRRGATQYVIATGSDVGGWKTVLREGGK